MSGRAMDHSFAAYGPDTAGNHARALTAWAVAMGAPSAPEAIMAEAKQNLAAGPVLDDVSAPGGRLDTRVMLKSLAAMAVRGEELSEIWTARLNGLQQRFEVSKTLHATYGPDLRGGDEALSDPQAHAQLALCLLARFRSQGSFNDLNTALKLCDMLCRGRWGREYSEEDSGDASEDMAADRPKASPEALPVALAAHLLKAEIQDAEGGGHA